MLSLPSHQIRPLRGEYTSPPRAAAPFPLTGAAPQPYRRARTTDLLHTSSRAPWLLMQCFVLGSTLREGRATLRGLQASGYMRTCIVPSCHMTCMTPGPYPLLRNFLATQPRFRRVKSTTRTPSGLATFPGDLSLSSLTHLSICTLDSLERSVLVVPMDEGSLDCF